MFISVPLRAAPLWRARLASTPVLLGLLALWLLGTLGLRPLLVPDEGRYAEVARAMWAHGDWLVPRLDGLPFFHKPPLFYWLDIVAFRMSGIDEFAGRFGSAFGAWLMGAALWLAMRRWHGPRAATITLGVLATTPFFYIAGQYANHDMLVGGLIVAAILAFVRAVEPVSPGDEPNGTLRWTVTGWLLCALALLAKGLIGVVLPALVIGPWLLAQGRWRALLGLLHPLGLAAFAAVGLPWFVAMQLRYPGFFDYFIVEQHFRRFALAEFNNAHGPWFFLAVLPLATLPWSWCLPAAWRHARRERSPLIGLYAWWTFAIVAFFTLPSSKLAGYVLPALAPWCALLGLAIAARRTHAWRTTLGAAALACLAIVGIGTWKAPESHKALALTLAQAMAPRDTVVMVDEYFYAVPYYAELARPALIASDWADPAIPRRDNWRKEIFDAARFEPALARTLLRPLSGLDQLACGAGAVWFVVPVGHSERVAALAGAVRRFADRRAELWRVPGRAC